MDDEQMVAAEESSRSASASSTSKLSSMGSGRESSSKASPTASSKKALRIRALLPKVEVDGEERWRRARGGCEPFLV